LLRLIGCSAAPIPNREWNPRDGRITQLRLHCFVDETLHNDVVIAVAGRSILSTDS
jgi:hypothetical protein